MLFCLPFVIDYKLWCRDFFFFCSLMCYQHLRSEVAQLCLTLCDPMDCSLPGSSCPWDFPGNSPGVDCHFLLQGIFPSQGSNLGLPHCKQTLYRLSHQGSPFGREGLGFSLLKSRSDHFQYTPCSHHTHSLITFLNFPECLQESH